MIGSVRFHSTFPSSDVVASSTARQRAADAPSTRTFVHFPFAFRASVTESECTRQSGSYRCYTCGDNRDSDVWSIRRCLPDRRLSKESRSRPGDGYWLSLARQNVDEHSIWCSSRNSQPLSHFIAWITLLPIHCVLSVCYVAELGTIAAQYISS